MKVILLLICMFAGMILICGTFENLRKRHNRRAERLNNQDAYSQDMFSEIGKGK